MSKLATSLVVLVAFSLGEVESIRAAEIFRVFSNGLQVLGIGNEFNERISIRVDTGVGLLREGGDQGGAVAATLASLLEAPTKNGKKSEWLKSVLSSGLSIAPHLDSHSSGFTLSGEAALLPRALWLVGERIAHFEITEGDVRHIKSSLWVGAESDRYEAITGRGNEVDTTAHAVLGEALGRTAFESRLRATRLPSAAFRDSVRALQRHVAWHLTVVAPMDISEAFEPLFKTYLESLPQTRWTASEASKGRAVTLGGAPKPMEALVSVRFENLRDQSTLVTLGWNLSQVQAELGWTADRMDATVQILIEALEHDGAHFQRNLTTKGSAILASRVQVVGTRHAALVLSASARTRRSFDANKALKEAFSRLSDRLDGEQVRGLRQSRVLWLRLLAQDPDRLSGVFGELWLSGRLAPRDGASPWWNRFTAMVAAVPAEDVAGLVRTLSQMPGRVEARFIPRRRQAGKEISLTEEIVDTYERIITDNRCPRPGAHPKWTKVLETKYRMTAETYVRLSQKIAGQPRLMRSVSQAALRRCERYEKLRKLKSYDEIAAIHRAVACGSGHIKDFQKRQRALRKVFGGFDLDPSVYRPLVAMAREDTQANVLLQRIDEECRPQYGPGTKR